MLIFFSHSKVQVATPQGNRGWISALNQKGAFVVEVKQRGSANMICLYVLCVECGRYCSGCCVFLIFKVLVRARPCCFSNLRFGRGK